jgi:probable phosphoglycerate mutase
MKQSNEILFYIVRHGRTHFNMTDQVQGHCDSPLTKEGIAQAKIVGKKFANMNFAAAFSSDLARQKNTAKIIIAQNKKTKPDLLEELGLREWCFGGFEGGSNLFFLQAILRYHKVSYTDATDARSKYVALSQKFGEKGFSQGLRATDPLNMAEPYDKIVARVKKGMDNMIKHSVALHRKNSKNPNDPINVLIVSSGCLIRTLLHVYAHKMYKGSNIQNCSVSKLVLKNSKFILEYHGDVSHLSNSPGR